MRMSVMGGLAAALLGSVLGCGDTAPRGDTDAREDRNDRAGVTQMPCQPTASGPRWIEEGKTLTLKLSCATGISVPGSAFTLQPLPRGAKYDASTATLTWKPGLDQAAVYELSIEGPGNERTPVKVGVLDNWSHPRNEPVADPLRYTEEQGLPVFHLQGASRLGHDAHVPITVIYRGHTYAAEAKLRGNASLAFPKNSYTLKFSEEDPFNEPELGGGFKNRRSLVLVNTFNDNSYLRARLGFELWSRLSPRGLQVKTYSAVVFIDGTYHGLYTVADHLTKHTMQAQGLSKQGNLYKAETGEADFHLEDASGQPKSTLHAGFEKQDGKPEADEPGAFDDLHAFITFVTTASPEAFRTEGPQRFSVEDYGNWWALVTLLVAMDSDVKNAYHYHDPSGGPWRYIPWDLDGTFGQTWKTHRQKPTTALDTGQSNGMFRRLLSEPTFAGPLKARLRTALSNELAPALLHARLDALARELGPSARRDEARWKSRYRHFPKWAYRDDFTTFDEEVEYIREWITLRWAFLDAQLAPVP